MRFKASESLTVSLLHIAFIFLVFTQACCRNITLLPTAQNL